MSDASDIRMPAALQDRPELAEWYRRSVDCIRAACVGEPYSTRLSCVQCGDVFRSAKSLSLHWHRTHKKEAAS